MTTSRTHFNSYLQAVAAIGRGDAAMLKVSLQENADLAEVTDLMLQAAASAQPGAIAMLEVLKNAGMDPTRIRDKDGHVCLLSAHPRNMAWLFEHGCVPQLEPDLVIWAVEKCAENLKDEEGPAAVERLRHIVAMGADVNCREKTEASTPLILATSEKRLANQSPERQPRMLEAARILIEAGADVNARYRTGMSVLTQAIAPHNVAAVELLLRHGATTDPGCGQEAWIASAAVRGDSAASLAILADRGFDLRTMLTDNENLTIPNSCIVHDAAASLAFLLDSGIFAPDEVTTRVPPNLKCAEVLRAAQARDAAEAALRDTGLAP